MKSKAAIAFAAGKPLEIVTVDLAGPKDGEVLVEIKASGVCHTDEFTRSGADPEGLFPAILGHEGDRVGLDVLAHPDTEAQRVHFGVGRRAAFGFDALQRSDGFDIVESLVAETAFADAVRVRYSEITGWDWLGVGLPDDCGFFGRSSPGRNAHSRVASSHAAWYSIF